LRNFLIIIFFFKQVNLSRAVEFTKWILIILSRLKKISKQYGICSKNISESLLSKEEKTKYPPSPILSFVKETLSKDKRFKLKVLQCQCLCSEIIKNRKK